MKIQRIKDIITGSVITAIVIGTGATAFAKATNMNIPVSFNNIKIIVDGKAIETDKEPFIYDGTTYLPVRAVGEAIGKEVSWDGNTNTVILGGNSSNLATSETNKVVYDDNGIKITYTGITESSGLMGGKKIGLVIENNTSKNYTVQVRNFSINGVMVNPIFSCDVAAGKKAVDDIDIWQSEVDDKNISSIYSAEFTFHILNWDSMNDYFDSDVISIER